ncbi:sacsin N-terminal ATP-binding-like domain-containing protein [Flavobacterium aestuarii]|uniref:sacsin N-terminal ATP-binding-like domain-containing protein n=1 Tax=Flavobacterium aestuarii TaxID=3149227 RepID=UPI0032B3C22F
MKEFVLDLIEKKKKRYQDDYSEMLGDYNRELETVKGYNGRQILELLQNCDDEGAKKVLIKLDIDLKTITISNDGKPFSQKGYRSLFIANLSSKTTKKKYIGNKGLGFRSIINWSNTIEIQSNTISLTYSEENVAVCFNQFFPEELQKEIRSEENLSDYVTPMPFLSMPILNDIGQLEYVTSIIIHYKNDYFNDIQKQIKKITSETLLFLRNIEEIKFEGFEDKDNISCKREAINTDSTDFAPKGKITFNDYTWYIFEEEKKLPEELSDSNKKEEELYQIKIAVEKNFEHSSPNLYSFFPTNIKLDQPYVLHATFDLDATRNQINDSKKNKYILNKIVDFTVNVAKFYTAEKVSYRPLEILNHKHSADTLHNLGYYDLIQEAIRVESVFPCIDNTYKKLEDVIYVSDQFATMLMKIKANDMIKVHILPLEQNILKEFILDTKIDRSLSVFENFTELINQIAHLDLSNYNRALFISQIVKECQFLKNSQENKINFLVNDKEEIINGHEYIYTPITLNNSLEIPSYTNIQFINKNLYTLLVDLLNYNAKENPNKARFIYDQLKGFCNIHSYEPTTLALKIISETNNIIKEKTENALDYIKEMNKCLYSNYRKTDDDAVKSVIPTSVPSITKSKKIKFTDEVSLSEYYPTGKKTTLIFEEVYNDDDYISSPLELGITQFEDIIDVENYLIWLGVNKYVKYTKDNTKTTERYFNYVLKFKGITDSTGGSILFKNINNFELILSKLSVNKLILWIYFDEELKKQINDSLNEDVIKNYYRVYNILTDKPSFIKFIIDTKYNISFKNLLIDERYYWVNDFNIDYRYKEFLEIGLTKSSINEILVLLGAKDDFNHISIDKVAEIINRIPKQFSDGKKSQSFYKRALNHYKINNKVLRKPLDLFADNGSELKLYSQKEIYFNDKIKLPKRLKQDFPIFNFPVRAGGAEAIKFFGINDLKILKVEIISHNPIGDRTSQFNEYLDKLKPLILTQRINVIEENKLRKIQASICNKIEIILCSNIKYKVLDKEYEVADYEFLHYANETYYLKISEHDSLNHLCKNFNFTESFADILSLSFDVSGDKNEFKHLIRNDFDYALQNVKNDFGDDTLQEARELLGLADYKQAFWQAIFEAKDLEYFEHIDDLSLENLINEKLGISFNLSDIDYENLNQEIQLRKVESLFENLNLELEYFAKKYSYKITMQNVHFNFLKNTILSKKKVIKATIWQSLADKDIESQAQFLNEINKFENFEVFAEKTALENEYRFSLKMNDILKQYIDSIYGEIKVIEEINIDKYRYQNLKNFDDNEQYEINHSERYKSLIYFENAIESLKKELEKEKLEAQKTLISRMGNSNNEISNDVDPIIISSDKLKQKSVNNKTKNKNTNVYTPKPKDNKRLKEIGNSSEVLVYNHLLKDSNYKEVYLASIDNEGLHYDIRYTDINNVVKYVEVKTFDNNYFHLTKDEYDFGFNNQDDYEIWLVNDKKNIIPIKDFFINKKYEVVSNEFLVYLEISK